MFIFGSRFKALASIPLNIECSNCKTNQQLAHIQQAYIHTFWIPFFPIFKVASLECQHCKKVLKQFEIPVEYKETINKAKSLTKTSPFLFTGLISLLMLIFSISWD